MPNYLPVKIEIQNSSNLSWLDVSDGKVYRVNKGTFENSAITFRRDEVTNAFVEGKFLVNALRDNVTETLAIYAYGDSSPVWVSGTTYSAGNFVSYLGVTYMRLIAGAGTTPPNGDATNWVAYSSTATLKTAIDTLTALVSQINFNVRITLDGSQRLWECFASDYTVNVTNEFFHNRQALITVQLQRLPSETVTTV